MEELEQETQVVVEEQPAQVEQDQRRSGRIRHLPEIYGYLIKVMYYSWIKMSL